MKVILSIDELGLTQLYLNQRKVEAVTNWLNENSVTSTVVTVIYYRNKPYLIDGHTRAFVAYGNGTRQIIAEIYEADLDTAEMQLYLTCIKWCQEQGLYHIADLNTRIISEEVFSEKWIHRCTNWMDQMENEKERSFLNSGYKK